MSQSLPFRFMAITEQTICPEPIPDRLNRLSELGIPAVQIRDKSIHDRTRYEWFRSVKRGGTLWFMNGRIDFALLEDLDGVHRPSNGVPLQEMNQIGGNKILYGQSTHSIAEAHRAFEQGADYILFGPIYPTASKPNLGTKDIPGLAGLEAVTEQLDGPILALGGITPDRVPACLDAGAYGVAGIRILFEPEDPRPNWKQIKNSLPKKE